VRSHLAGRARDAEDKGVGAGVAGAAPGEEGQVHARVRMWLPLQQNNQQQGDVDVEGEAPPPPGLLGIAFVPAASTTSSSGALQSPTIPPLSVTVAQAREVSRTSSSSTPRGAIRWTIRRAVHWSKYNRLKVFSKKFITYLIYFARSFNCMHQ
jgi:hypothetical protein